MARARALPFIVALALATGCFKTNVVIDAFNGGLLDTAVGDPQRSPDERSTSLVMARARQELADAYFGQGPGDPYVAEWLEAFGGNEAFTTDVLAVSCGSGVNIGEACNRAERRPAESIAVQMNPTEQLGGGRTLTEVREEIREHARAAIRAKPSPLDNQPACINEELQKSVVARVADQVRFETAYERAVFSVASLVAEHVATKEQTSRGGKEAFRQTGRYLRDRGWKRTFARPPAALIVKGGAAAGIFSAGATWAVLHVIDGCMNTPWCREKHGDIRFEMLSGTSTGAMIVAAADRFNDDDTAVVRAQEMKNLAGWFTCEGMSDLYCIRQQPMLDLARDQDGALDFKGLRGLLRDNLSCKEIVNRSEIILNTVDFRSGQLLQLSDQERFSMKTPEDLVQGALASAVLPVIATPVYTLPSNYNSRIPATYLDGGIRSEIPVMAAVRRGAGRVLVIGSSSSVPGSSGRLKSAASIMARYIDISISGLIETELAQSQSHVESLRLAETDACSDNETLKRICTGNCDPVALCEADWEWVCKRRPTTGPEARPERKKLTLAQRIAPMWRMGAIFRDEERVETLHGYSFDPPEQRRLFMAGVDSVRVSCTRVADLLGIGVPSDPNDPRRREIIRWCSPEPPAACPPRPPGKKVEAGNCADTPPEPPARTNECRKAEL